MQFHAYSMASVFENDLVNFLDGCITYCAGLRVILKNETYPMRQGNSLYVCN